MIRTENMVKEYQKFYEMDIWKDGYQLQKEVFELTKMFPKEEKYGLVIQMSNAANSVIANFAEAHGRFHYADKIRVLYIVRGEIEEIQNHLFVATGRNYVTEPIAGVLISRYEKLKMKINGYISDFSHQRNQS